MKPIQSALDNRLYAYDQVWEQLGRQRFTLGGNWDYDKGCFDRALDDKNQVWLRLPFTVAVGILEGPEIAHPGMQIQLGTPFVLNHLYQEGNDDEAVPRTLGALVDQFQKPADPDASVDDVWVDKARAIWREVEQGLL